VPNSERDECHRLQGGGVQAKEQSARFNQAGLNRGVIGPKSGSPGRSLKRGGHGHQFRAKWK
jgi:hypothetical protein